MNLSMHDISTLSPDEAKLMLAKLHEQAGGSSRDLTMKLYIASTFLALLTAFPFAVLETNSVINFITFGIFAPLVLLATLTCKVGRLYSFVNSAIRLSIIGALIYSYSIPDYNHLGVDRVWPYALGHVIFVMIIVTVQFQKILSVNGRLNKVAALHDRAQH